MDTKVLNRAFKLLSDEIDPGLSIQTMRVFLFIAQKGECSLVEIEQGLNMTNASTSRNVSYWTERRFDRKPGKNMVERLIDDYDQRYKIVRLNDAGKQFYEKIKAL